MDYMLDREAMAVNEALYDGCQEQPVDLNINLPDYCPDIQRILKCQIYPKITSRSISGDRLILEGGYVVKVFYLDSAGTNLRSVEGNDAFSAEITLKQPAENARGYAFPRVEYINCRAASPRRLDIHGAFSLCAKVFMQSQNEVVGNISGDDVEQQKKTVGLNSVAGFSQQQFGIDEILELGAGKPAADSILKTDAFAVLQDFKEAAGKLMVKGEACIKFLYASVNEDNLPETMEYTIPFSQMLDCDGVTEDCMCSVKIEVVGVDAQIKNDYSGDKTFFDTQVKLYANAVAYKKQDITIVNDAYSKQYDLEITAKPKTLDNLMELTGDTYVDKSSLTVDDNEIEKIIDVWNEMGSVTAETENGQIKFKGKYNLCVLAAGSQNKPFYFERLLDFEYARPLSSHADNIRCEADVNIGGVSYRIVGGGIEARTELRLTAEVYSRYSFKMITDVSADESRTAEQDRSAALVLYYADAGENLWNIARDYRTSVEAIAKENSLSGEVTENRGMLLIPM